MLALVAASLLTANWIAHDGRAFHVLVAAIPQLVALVILAVVLYLPYYFDLEADAQGINAIRTLATPPAQIPPNSEVTRPVHFVLFWAPLLAIGLSFVVAYLARNRRAKALKLVGALALLLACGPAAMWAGAILVADGPGSLLDELQERHTSVITLGALMVVVATALVSAMPAFNRKAEDEGHASSFALLLAAAALVMLLGSELFFVDDLFDWRANTVFRFWHQAWILLSIAGAYGMHYITRNWRVPWVGVRWRTIAAGSLAACVVYTGFVAIDPWETLYSRWWTATAGLLVAGGIFLALAVSCARRDASPLAFSRRLVWIGGVGGVLAAGFAYPVLVTFDRTDGFRNDQTLNGIEFVQRSDPGEYEAIQWLNANVSGSPVILEAAGADFSTSGRISSRTGLPTVIGWVGHEVQWRGPPKPDASTPFTTRPGDVDRVYTTLDIDEAQATIARYSVQYVYVGELERRTYGISGLLKFNEFMIPVFAKDGVTIYRMPAEQVTPGASGP